MRSRRQSRRSHSLSPTLPNRGIGAAPRSTGKTAGAAVLGRRVNTTPVTLTTRNSSNPHNPRATHRGFVPRGLSYAKRRPKLLTGTEWQLSNPRREKLPPSKLATDQPITDLGTTLPDKIKQMRQPAVLGNVCSSLSSDRLDICAKSAHLPGIESRQRLYATKTDSCCDRSQCCRVRRH
jgi:hypothetical protein